MGHRQYSGNHPRFSKRADERYDAKEAYNKDLTASARLHYLENVRHDHDSPAELNMRYGVSRHKSGHLDAYEGVDPKSLHPYDDGAGGIDYEAMDRDNKMMMQKDIRPKEKISKKAAKRVINEAMMQKATKAEVSAKLREQFPDVKDNSVEVNWSPDGKEVEVHNNKSYTKELKTIPKKKVKSYTQEAKPIPKKRSYTKELKAIKKKKAISPVNQGSPMKMEGKGCAKSEGGSGCVVERGGEYVILNNKKGGIFQSGFKSKRTAERSLAGYHANK